MQGREPASCAVMGFVSARARSALRREFDRAVAEHMGQVLRPGGNWIAYDNAPKFKSTSDFPAPTPLSACTPISVSELQLGQVHRCAYKALYL